MAKAGSTFSNFKSPFQRSATWGPAAGNPAVQTDQTAGAAQAPAWAPGQAPWDTAYEKSVSGLDLNKTNALASIAKARANTSQLYGLNADGTDNTTDPLSRLASLRADFEKLKHGSSASYAARGLGYDGSYQNKVNSDYQSNMRSTDALKKDFAAANTSLDNQTLQVNSNYNTDIAGQEWNRASAAAQNVATGAVDVGAPASPTAAPTRRDAVMAALNGNLGPTVRKRLAAEAKKNGWA